MSVLERAYQKAREQLIPLKVHFDLTYRCHHQCVHCYLPKTWRRGESPQELTTAQVKGILDQLAAAGTFFLTFSGGEIFLRPDIFPILNHAKSLNFCLELMSTGTMGLEEEQIEALTDLGVGALYFSMYSRKEQIHDQITGVPGSCARLIRTIENCRSRDMQVVLNCSVFRLNCSDIKDLKEFADQLDLNLRLSDEFSPHWDGSLMPPSLLLSQQERRSFQESLGTGEDKSPTEPVTTTIESGDRGCGVASDMCYISPQGEVWPCLEVPLNCGRLDAEQDFLTIWERSAMLKWVRSCITDLGVHGRFCDYFREKGLQDWHSITTKGDPQHEHHPKEG